MERPIFDHRVKWTVGTVCGYLLITHFLLQIFRTDGLSMLPSLPSGAFVVVNKVGGSCRVDVLVVVAKERGRPPVTYSRERDGA